jgi:ribA/ribD-fused uncharacterized protein
MTQTPMFRGDLEFLSNFSQHKAILDEWHYPTAEHAYQAAKTLSLPVRTLFLDGTAGQAKRRGRTVDLRPDWEQVKVPVMRGILATKFGQNTELSKHLIATGNLTLVETNHWHDNIWGDCYCGSERCAGQGQNLLGQSLMWLRSYLAGWLT